MKKIAAIIILAAMSILSSLTGCSGKEKMHFFEDRVYYHHEGNDDVITFMVNYAYSEDKPEIELVELIGEGLEQVTYELGDVSEDLFTTNKYNGYHIGTFYVDLDVSQLADNDEISVNSMSINCNGQEKQLNFEEELCFTKNDFEEACYRVPLQLLQIPNGMAVNDVNYPIEYCFDVNEEFTLTEFTANELIDVKEAVIYVNDIIVGNADDVLPLELSENDRLKLEVIFSINEEKECSNINTDVIISGLNAENELMKRHFSLFLTSLMDESDANSLTAIISK